MSTGDLRSRRKGHGSGHSNQRAGRRKRLTRKRRVSRPGDAPFDEGRRD